MAKPELLTIQNGGFARGADAFENDGLILAEIIGHCDPEINITHFNKYWTVDVNTRSSWHFSGLPADAAPIVVFAMAFMRNAKLIRSHYIGYAGNTTATKFEDDSGTSGHNLDVAVTMTDVFGVEKTLLSVEVDEANTDYEDTTTEEFTRDSVMKVYFTRNDPGSGTDFDPYIQAKFVFKEEHTA